jgi:hypothetical protein
MPISQGGGLLTAHSATALADGRAVGLFGLFPPDRLNSQPDGRDKG